MADYATDEPRVQVRFQDGIRRSRAFRSSQHGTGERRGDEPLPSIERDRGERPVQPPDVDHRHLQQRREPDGTHNHRLANSPRNAETGVCQTSWPTRKAANEFLARVAVDVQRGEYVSLDNARRPLGSIAEEWVASLYHLKPKTLMNYENTLRYHVLPRLGETPVGAIDQRRVRRFITDMLGDGVSPAQVRKAVGRRKQTLDLAVELGTIRKNPCVGVKLPPMPPRRCTS